MADNSAGHPNEPERPRFEPEIIPPSHSGRRDREENWPPPPYSDTQMRGSHRVYVGRIGPFGFALVMLVVGLLVAVLLLILIGEIGRAHV